jgi:thymidylate synthase (FAD)
MKYITAGYTIMDTLDEQAMLKKIERCGRIAYQSQDKTTENSCVAFVKNLIKREHESVLEHVVFTVVFIVDRGLSHEIVRHRLASYTQSSTRYYRFKDDVTFVIPQADGVGYNVGTWHKACADAEKAYFKLLETQAPEIARNVLPMSTATELAMTANIREWRHFFRLRAAPTAHPQLRTLVNKLLVELKTKLPTIFGDL